MLQYSSPPVVTTLLKRFEARSATIAVVGLGYVGLPLVKALLGVPFKVIGLDADPEKVAALKEGRNYIRHVSAELFKAAFTKGQFSPTNEFGALTGADAILLCVPTPLTSHREPDLRFVEASTQGLSPFLKRGQLIVLESTTYPGTTAQVMKPILEAGGLRSGRDFFMAYSPEREDPGNPTYSTAVIPKVIGGDGPDALQLAEALYGTFVPKTVPVSSLEAAEAVKLTENIFRAVNIALVNELKVIYDAMGIDVWEIIEAAKTKPFGYMPFYPGPGLGGHCIPIDPFYLTWKAREYELSTQFIELAGQVNTQMPRYVVARLAAELDRRTGKGLNGAKVLIIGVAYKKNIDDTRESVSFKLIELLEQRGASCDVHDPYVPVIPPTREYPALAGRRSVPVDPPSLAKYDVVLIATDHDIVDYKALVSAAKLVVDTRNACAHAGAACSNVIRA
jgi:UDP-N-acetyl-D-glucosamine dehydrogenase